MVAMPLFDLIIVVIWLGGLTLFLLGQAVLSWLRLRYARRCARHAARLSEVTRAVSTRDSSAPDPELLDSVPGRAYTGSKATALPTR
jgi:hypothetical protein